jgi:hypothetical protein
LCVDVCQTTTTVQFVRRGLSEINQCSFRTEVTINVPQSWDASQCEHTPDCGITGIHPASTLATDVPRDIEPQREPTPLVCHICGKTATCHGTYQGTTGYSCDDCCGHGCEDGHCEPIAAPETYTVETNGKQTVVEANGHIFNAPPTPLVAGDWVVCVEGHSDYLKQGKVYQIAEVGEWVYLDAAGDERGGWCAHRFRRATTAPSSRHRVTDLLFFVQRG